LVAEERREVVGHIAFSPVIVLGATDGVGLAPVAVLPAFRRRGIAHQLIERGLVVCGQLGKGFVVVLGDPSYYRRVLRTDAIPASGGVVHYAPEFAGVEG
jgi:putative acetyltransferase